MEIFGSSVSERSAIPTFIEFWLIAVLLGSWWYFPFLMQGGTTHIAKHTSLVAGPTRQADILQHIILITGLKMTASNLWSPGPIQFLFALLGCGIAIRYRGRGRLLFSGLFIITLIALFSGWLRIPLGLPDRIAPYFSFFTAIMCGFTIQIIRTQLGKKTYRNKVLILLLGLILISICYNVSCIMEVFGNREFETTVPQELLWLKDHAKPGERIVSEHIYWQWRITAYTDLDQWGGSDLFAMTNDFSYHFWYQLFYSKNLKSLPYFARNFNVRFFLGHSFEGTKQVYPGIWEVENFSSSLFEVVRSNVVLVLFIGSRPSYEDLFLAISPLDPEEFLLVYGGKDLTAFDLQTLKHFQAVYIEGLSLQNMQTAASLLSEYLESGEGVIIDSEFNPDVEIWSSLPDPFPISETHRYEDNLTLKAGSSNQITYGVDFKEIMNKRYVISTLTPKEGAEEIISDKGKTVMAVWNYSLGRILWSGLALPRHAIKDEDLEESKLLLNTLKYAAKPPSKPDMIPASFHYSGSEAIVYLTNAQLNDAIWFKMSYYSGWTASIDGRELKIFEAGPYFMLVFPEIEGDGEVYFRFVGTWDLQVGEALSLLGIGLIALTIICQVTRLGHRLRHLKDDLLDRLIGGPEKPHGYYNRRVHRNPKG